MASLNAAQVAAEVVQHLLRMLGPPIRREGDPDGGFCRAAMRALVNGVNPQPRRLCLAAAGIAKRQSASVYLKTLARLGLLEEIKAGRENIYTNPALLALLSERDTAAEIQE